MCKRKNSKLVIMQYKTINKKQISKVVKRKIKILIANILHMIAKIKIKCKKLFNVELQNKDNKKYNKNNKKVKISYKNSNKYYKNSKQWVKGK